MCGNKLKKNNKTYVTKKEKIENLCVKDTKTFVRRKKTKKSTK